jgi:hypothetical protein
MPKKPFKQRLIEEQADKILAQGLLLSKRFVMQAILVAYNQGLLDGMAEEKELIRKEVRKDAS